MTREELVAAVTAVYMGLVDTVMVGPGEGLTRKQYCRAMALTHQRALRTTEEAIEEVVSLIDFPHLAKLIERMT